MPCGRREISRTGYRRRSYTRKDGIKVKATYVKPGCIEDRGAPGKGPVVVPTKTMEKGLLENLGYTQSKPTDRRHSALVHAVNKEGYKKIILHMNAIATLNKRTNPGFAEKIKNDMDFIRRRFRSSSRKSRSGGSRKSRKSRKSRRSRA